MYLEYVLNGCELLLVSSYGCFCWSLKTILGVLPMSLSLFYRKIKKV